MSPRPGKSGHQFCLGGSACDGFLLHFPVAFADPPRRDHHTQRGLQELPHPRKSHRRMYPVAFAHQELGMVKPVDLAYAAGIVDGEGCIRAHKDHRSENKFQPVVVIEMSEFETIAWFKQVFGGSRIYRPKIRKAHHRTTYRWEICGEKALDFLSAILPYMRGKKAQAEKMLTWPRGRSGVTVTADVKQARLGIYLRLQEMKRETQQLPSGF